MNALRPANRRVLSRQADAWIHLARSPLGAAPIRRADRYGGSDTSVWDTRPCASCIDPPELRYSHGVVDDLGIRSRSTVVQLRRDPSPF